MLEKLLQQFFLIEELQTLHSTRNKNNFTYLRLYDKNSLKESDINSNIVIFLEKVYKKQKSKGNLSQCHDGWARKCAAGFYRVQYI